MKRTSVGRRMKEAMDLLVVATRTFLRSVRREISLNARLALNDGVLQRKILLLHCSNKVLEKRSEKLNLFLIWVFFLQEVREGSTTINRIFVKKRKTRAAESSSAHCHISHLVSLYFMLTVCSITSKKPAGHQRTLCFQFFLPRLNK